MGGIGCGPCFKVLCTPVTQEHAGTPAQTRTRARSYPRILTEARELARARAPARVRACVPAVSRGHAEKGPCVAGNVVGQLLAIESSRAHALSGVSARASARWDGRVW